jgi:DNA polymerase-3 subunit gamma/tau
VSATPDPTQSTERGVGATALARAVPAPILPAPAERETPRLASFRDVAQLVASQREATLHAHLVHSVRPIRFAPPVIELRPLPEAPRDLSARLAKLLTEVTGTRWTIAIGTAQGEPTLAEQSGAADRQRRDEAGGHPLVRAILDAFPGATITEVRDERVDFYGLPMDKRAAPDDMPDFAPPDAAFLDDDDASPWETDS